MKDKIRYSEAFKLKVTVEMHCYDNAMAALNCAARAEATPCRQTAQPKNAVLTFNRDLTVRLRNRHIGFPQSSRKGNGFEDGRFLTVDSIFSK